MFEIKEYTPVNGYVRQQTKLVQEAWLKRTLL